MKMSLMSHSVRIAEKRFEFHEFLFFSVNNIKIIYIVFQKVDNGQVGGQSQGFLQIFWLKGHSDSYTEYQGPRLNIVPTGQDRCRYCMLQNLN